VLWNDSTARAHVLVLGDAPCESGTHRCTALCVRVLANERPACTLVSDSLQLTLRLRVTHVLPAAADECEAVVLRRADVPEPTASNAADALYVVLRFGVESKWCDSTVLRFEGSQALARVVLPATDDEGMARGCFVAKSKRLYIPSRSRGQPWRPLAHARSLVICVRQVDVLASVPPPSIVGDLSGHGLWIHRPRIVHFIVPHSSSSNKRASALLSPPRRGNALSCM
jgi:hypothetical protein